jgi:hypothetical protein
MIPRQKSILNAINYIRTEANEVKVNKLDESFIIFRIYETAL